MKKIPFENLEVAFVFDNYPSNVKKKLLELRDLIFSIASKTHGVGNLTETLKWGQPSYLTQETKTGTTLRIDKVKKSFDKYVIYVHCQTTLIESFRKKYKKEFQFDGNRGIIFNISDNIPKEKISEFIKSALTYQKRTK
jgi:hypothetical protein